jgi:hypothetical protein
LVASPWHGSIEELCSLFLAKNLVKVQMSLSHVVTAVSGSLESLGEGEGREQGQGRAMGD